VSTSRGEIIEALAGLGTSEAESFFIEHGLGSAFAAPNLGWGRRKRVNEALVAAERRGDIDAVLADARQRFLEPAVAPKPLRKIVPRSQARSAVPASKPLVFISHAEADKHLAEAVQNLLRLGTALSSDNVFCSSLPGLGVPVGTQNYNGHIRDRLNDAKLVIPIVTSAFVESTMCLIELGGVWGAELPMFPIVVSPVQFSTVEAGIGKVQMARIDKADDLGRLHDAVVNNLGLTGKTDMWNKEQAKFLKLLPSLAKKLAKPTKIEAAAHNAALKEITELKAELVEIQEAHNELQERFGRVASLKDAEEVAETAPPASVVERFETLLDVAQKALFVLPQLVRLGIYEEFGRGEEWRPSYAEWASEIERAEQDELIMLQSDDGYFYLNEDEPAVGEALEAVRHLFDLEADDEFESWFRAKYRRPFRQQNRQVWEQLGLL
jgi:hypothetical protein